MHWLRRHCSCNRCWCLNSNSVEAANQFQTSSICCFEIGPTKYKGTRWLYLLSGACMDWHQCTCRLDWEELPALTVAYICHPQRPYLLCSALSHQMHNASIGECRLLVANVRTWKFWSLVIAVQTIAEFKQQHKTAISYPKWWLKCLLCSNGNDTPYKSYKFSFCPDTTKWLHFIMTW